MTEETSRLSEYDLGISSSLGLVKGIIALFQLYSIVSFIITEKHEKNRINDYAAFQLTLIPYGLMSLVNILCGLVTPTYSAVYMVNSTIMEEARARGWTFDGTVGKLCENTEKDSSVGFGFLVTFEKDSVDKPGKEGRTNALAKVNNDQIREVGTSLLPKVNKNEVSEAVPRTGSRGEIKIGCSSVKQGPRSNRLEFGANLKEASRELAFIRLFLLKDQDPGKDYVKSLLSSKEWERSDEPTRIVIPPIGNPTYRKGSWWRFLMLAISDLIVLVSIALPYLVTWGLTKFKAPTGENLHGGVFMAWLVLGQLAPILARITWEFLRSAQLRRWEWVGWYAFLLFLVGSWSIPAIWGFILVGKEMYFHPENDAPRG